MPAVLPSEYLAACVLCMAVQIEVLPLLLRLGGPGLPHDDLYAEARERDIEEGECLVPGSGVGWGVCVGGGGGGGVGGGGVQLQGWDGLLLCSRGYRVWWPGP